MPVTVEEKYLGRSGTDDSPELEFIVEGTDDDAVVFSEVASNAPSTHRDQPRQRISIEQVDDQRWVATVSYGPSSSTSAAANGGGSAAAETGSPTFNFDTTGATQHVTQSKETTGRFKASGEVQATNHHGAIGVTDSGVQGTDVVSRQYRFSETHIKADVDVDSDYKGKLFHLTGRTNDAEFKGFAIGEVLFMGAVGGQRADGTWSITYYFAASENKADFTVGGITITSKKGWEYLWFEYAEEKDDVAKRIVRRPISAHVEKVYEEGDLADLEIGT